MARGPGLLRLCVLRYPQFRPRIDRSNGGQAPLSESGFSAFAFIVLSRAGNRYAAKQNKLEHFSARLPLARARSDTGQAAEKCSRSHFGVTSICLLHK